MRLRLQKSLFRLSSGLTDHAPRTGARFLDAVLIPVLTSRQVERQFAARSNEAVKRAGRLRRVLVLSDIHLGDALLAQPMVTAVRDFFPGAEVHYVISRAAACLARGNPEVTVLHPLYTGGSLPSASDHQGVAQTCREGTFDLVVNASPSFLPGNPIPRHLPTLCITGHAPHLLRNERAPSEPNHFVYQNHLFLHEVLGRRFRPQRQEPLRGVSLNLGDEALGEAEAFLEGLNGHRRDPLVLVNPDAASPFTRPPFELLTRLVEGLADGPAQVLLGEGHTDRGVGSRMIQALPARAASRVRLVPASLRADSYAALTDLVDVFVSGDTGPLHWAAARKRSLSGRTSWRNRTCVISLFGATPASMSGYDSRRPGFLPAWQDAPSFTFVSRPVCRNITCLNKLHKTCRLARCFEGLEADPVNEVIGRYLEERPDGGRRARRHRPERLAHPPGATAP